VININLLPKDLKRQGSTDYWKIGAIALATVSVSTMAILQFSVVGTLNSLDKEIAQNISEKQVLEPQVRERNDLQGRKTQLEAISAISTTLNASKTSWSGDLARFARHLPSGPQPVVAINSLSMRTLDAAAQQTAKQNGLYDGKAITREVQLSGKARSSAGMVQFVNAFENAPDFGVQFQNMSRDEESGHYTFSVTVGVLPAVAASESAPGASGNSAAPEAPQETQAQGTQSSAEAPAATMTASAGGSR